MRPVAADELVRERRHWRFPKRSVFAVATFTATWAIISIAVDGLHVHFDVVVAVVLVLAAVAITVDFLRRRRNRRANARLGA